MAITTTNPAQEPRSFSKGPVKFEIVNLAMISGATSGTVTASNLKELYHILIPGIKSHTAAPTFATNVATIACTVPAETAAAVTLQSLTYTAVADLGASGNSITIQYANTATAGAETVTVTGTAIVVGIETGVSTRNQVKTAVLASAPASALVVVTGASASAATTVAATPLTGGVSGGFYGPAICIGR